MTTPSCTPITDGADIRTRELRPDHLGSLLETLADLVVETGQQRRALEPLAESGGAPTRNALRQLVALEESLRQVGLEAAAVHQLLQHQHLI
jgi:hypothetical protein